jgi:ferrous-iron efflux pump FieF
MIEKIVTNVQGVKGFHDLRTRNAGQKIFIQMHVEISETLSLKEAHVIADAIEFGIQKVLPNADVIIHQDLHEEYSGAANQLECALHG